MQKQSLLPRLPRSWILKNGVIEILSFIRNSVEDLLTKRAIVYTVDNTAGAASRSFASNLMLLDDDELKRLQEKKEEGKSPMRFIRWWHPREIKKLSVYSVFTLLITSQIRSDVTQRWTAIIPSIKSFPRFLQFFQMIIRRSLAIFSMIRRSLGHYAKRDTFTV